MTDHKTFNIIDALQGVSYPEETVRISLDARLMHTISETSELVKKLEQQKKYDEANELTSKLDGMREAARDSFILFTLRSVDRAVLRSIDAKVDAKYPAQRSVLGQIERDEQREAYAEIMHLATHVVKVEFPNGAVQTDFDEASAKAFVDRAPTVSVEKLVQTIRDMYQDTTKGYEDTIKDLDFLSEASPEE